MAGRGEGYLHREKLSRQCMKFKGEQLTSNLPDATGIQNRTRVDLEPSCYKACSSAHSANAGVKVKTED